MSNDNGLNRFKNKILLESLYKSAVFSLICAFFVCLVCSVICYFTSYSGLALTLILGGVTIAVAFPLFFFLAFKPTEKTLALRLDAMGLNERALTMLEHKNDDSFMAQMQRVDAVKQISKCAKKQLKFNFIIIPVAMLTVVCAFSIFTMTLIPPPVNADTTPPVGQTEDEPPIPPDDEEDGPPAGGGDTPQPGESEKSAEDIIKDLYEGLKEKVENAEVDEEVKEQLNDVIEELNEQLNDAEDLNEMLDALKDASEKISEILDEQAESNPEQRPELEELKESLNQDLTDAEKELQEGEMPEDAEQQPGGNKEDESNSDDEEKTPGKDPDGKEPDGNEGDGYKPPEEKDHDYPKVIDGETDLTKEIYDEYYDLVMEMLKDDSISDEVRAIIEKYFGIIG